MYDSHSCGAYFEGMKSLYTLYSSAGVPEERQVEVICVVAASVAADTPGY